jgi:hypothetical protein
MLPSLSSPLAVAVFPGQTECALAERRWSVELPAETRDAKSREYPASQRRDAQAQAADHQAVTPVPRLVAAFPFADFLEAPALLCGCGPVPAGSAAFKAFGDPGAVLWRVVVVVFELGGDARDVEAQTADS